VKRRIGDRADGYRLRKLTAFNTIVPHIMVERVDTLVAGEFELDVAAAYTFLKAERAKGNNIAFMDLVIAAMIRTIAHYPSVNRFVCARKFYARSEIAICFVAKKKMTVEGEDTVIKAKFQPTDTIYEVSRKLHEKIDYIKREETSNSTSVFANSLGRLPVGLVAFVVGILKLMDKLGVMPKKIIELSPFHTSVFVTNFGSMGFPPIFHHIYNFGTTSVFLALGNYNTLRVIDHDGKVVVKKAVKISYVADERISDGFEMVTALKDFIGNIKNPERLTVPPEQVVIDRAL
jgi:hypothetical protein